MAQAHPWLSEQQQQAWRGYLRMQSRLGAHLNRRLHADSQLSLPDFEVLVQLSESGTGRLRAFELGQALQWEKSRVSHQVRRMAGRGLVEREDCADDGRGAFVVITEVGLEAIARAAPLHAAVVRTLIFDDLTPSRLAAFSALTESVLARLDETDSADSADGADGGALPANPTAG